MGVGIRRPALRTILALVSAVRRGPAESLRIFPAYPYVGRWTGDQCSLAASRVVHPVGVKPNPVV